jgi:hypothetical protein
MNIQALSKASTTMAGEHSSLTHAALDKNTEIWGNVRDVMEKFY